MYPATLLLKEGPISVRPITSADASVWLHYLKKVGNETDFLAFSGEDVRMTSDQACRYLDYISHKPNDLYLVAAFSGSLLASLHFQGSRWPRNRHRGEFGISVLAQYWGQGIARFLIHSLLSWAPEHHITKINLKVRTDNLRAIQLYHSLGFVIEGTLVRECCRQGIYYSAYHMGLKL